MQVLKNVGAICENVGGYGFKSTCVRVENMDACESFDSCPKTISFSDYFCPLQIHCKPNVQSTSLSVPTTNDLSTTTETQTTTTVVPSTTTATSTTTTSLVVTTQMINNDISREYVSQCF